MTEQEPLTVYPFFEDEDDDRLLAKESRLWWMTGRKAILRRILDRAVADRPVQRILDAGCGSGNNFDLLARYGEVVGCDASPVAVRRARSRKIATDVFVTEADWPNHPLRGFQLTCLFDVLEHVYDDRGFLARLNACVEKRHLLLVSVPACPWMYGPHDRLLRHFRRYRLKELERLLRAEGFQVIWATYFVTLLFPLIAVWRLVEKFRARFGPAQEQVNVGIMPDWINPILTRILAVEAALAARVRLPFGLWAMALAQKIDEVEDAGSSG